ncbi:MAG: hypothetical protein ACREDY_12185, partial [Bradyrhizobium sp.]
MTYHSLFVPKAPRGKRQMAGAAEAWFTPVPRPRFGSLDPFDLAFALLIVALILLTIWTVSDYAISNDEEVQHRYGELI